MFTSEIDRALTERLHEDGFDYVAETVDITPAARVVILHGRRRNWLEEEPRLLAKLRFYVADLHAFGVRHDFRFMDVDAMSRADDPRCSR